MIRLVSVFFVVASVFLTSCERRTEVKIEGGDNPTFILTGSGRLDEILVFAPEQEQISKGDPFDDTHAIWIIEPDATGEHAKRPVESVGVVTYGVVPNGYRQKRPKDGAPPPLMPGNRYKYWFITVNAPWAAGYFEIRDGKAVTVSGP